MKSFVEQPGMPLVTATVACDGEAGTAALTLQQRRFHDAGAQLADETWGIPVCVRYGGGSARARTPADTRVCTLLDGGSKTVPLESCPGWVEPNAGGLGYYHSAYSSAALTSAYAQADDGEKIALLRDASALVTSGDIKLGDALARVPASATSPVSQVVKGGLAIVDLAEQEVSPADETALAHFLGSVYGPIARKLGLRERAGDDPATLENRVTAVVRGAVDGDDPALRAAAHAAALAWLHDEKAIDPRARTAVLAAGARSNDVKLFDGLLERAKKETDKRRQVDLIYALASFTSPELVARAEATVLDGTFDPREGVFILDDQLGSHATREAAWTFLQQHWTEITGRMRSDEVGSYLLHSIDFCDADHLGQIEALAAARHQRRRRVTEARAGGAEDPRVHRRRRGEPLEPRGAAGPPPSLSHRAARARALLGGSRRGSASDVPAHRRPTGAARWKELRALVSAHVRLTSALLVTSACLVAWFFCKPLIPVFPLDDAYIHLAYVRCFARSGQFCFNPGEPSLGTSSPLSRAAAGPLLPGGLRPLRHGAVARAALLGGERAPLPGDRPAGVPRGGSQPRDRRRGRAARRRARRVERRGPMDGVQRNGDAAAPRGEPRSGLVVHPSGLRRRHRSAGRCLYLVRAPGAVIALVLLAIELSGGRWRRCLPGALVSADHRGRRCSW